MDKHRLSNAKSAVKAIIDSMSVHDFVGFITFSDQANTLGGTNRIERISEEVKDKLKADIDNLEANGKTNYQIAL